MVLSNASQSDSFFSYSITSVKGGTADPGSAMQLFQAMYGEVRSIQPGVAEEFQRSLSMGVTPYQEERANLWVVMAGEIPAACVGVKYYKPEICELKRMFVQPAFRGKALSRKLMELALPFARQVGYRFIYLDTLLEFETAHRLYYSCGFEKIEPYNELPSSMVYHMKLAL